MDLQRAFVILELTQGSTLPQVKRAYRDLAAVWHPDRHSNNPRLQQKAVKKMQEINTAYGLLQSHFSQTSQNTTQGTPSRSSTTAGIRYCPHCGAVIGSKNKNMCASCLQRQHVKRTAKAPSRRQRFGGLGLWRLCVVIATLFCLGGVGYILILKKPLAENELGYVDTTSERVILDGRFRIDQFNHLEQITLQRLQYNLAAMGYSVGIIDGLLGPKTLSAANQFYQDFSDLVEMKDASVLADMVARQADVSREYGEWRELVNSRKFERWLTVQDPVVQEKWQPGNLKLMVAMLDRYFFQQNQPPVLEPPLSSIVLQENTLGSRSVQLIAAGEKEHFFVKVLEETRGVEALSAFIRSGDSLSVKLYPGNYSIKFVSGERWYGKRYLFGLETFKGRIHEVLQVHGDNQGQELLAVRLRNESVDKKIKKPFSVFSF